MEGVNYTDPWKKILIKRGLATIMGLVIGDALGVPVEFASRDELKENPVTDMIGYGTPNQPAVHGQMIPVWQLQRWSGWER